MNQTPQAPTFSGTVSLGVMGKREVVLSPGQIVFGKHVVATHTIAEVRLRVTKNYVQGIPTSTNYRLQITDENRQRSTWSFGFTSMQKKDVKAYVTDVFNRLYDQLQREAGPQIVQRFIAANPQPDAAFGPWRFWPEGIVAKEAFQTVTVPWGQLAGSAMNQGMIQLRYRDPVGKERHAGAMSMWTPNAIFLDQFVAGYHRHFMS